MRLQRTLFILSLPLLLALAGCGDDVDKLGVGAQCAKAEDCTPEAKSCLTNFKGGYCGIAGCKADADCPAGAACVTEGGSNYCFRVCADKAECNANRDLANEANCSSNATFVDGGKGRKACIPPS